jgi:hypothetical protein
MKKWISSVGLLVLVTGCGSPAVANISSIATMHTQTNNTSANSVGLPLSAVATLNNVPSPAQEPSSVQIEFSMSGTVNVNQVIMTPTITGQSASLVHAGSVVSFVDPQVKDADALIKVDVFKNSQKIDTLTSNYLFQNSGYEVKSAGTYKFVIYSADGNPDSSASSALIKVVGVAPDPFQLSFTSQFDPGINVHVANYSQAGDTMNITYSGVPSAYSLEGAYYTGGYQNGGSGISWFRIGLPIGNSTRHALTFFIPETMRYSRFRIVLTFMNPQGHILVAESSVLQTG